MKIIKVIASLSLILTATFASRATVLFDDASNYPYANGCIEGQGQWYCYSPSSPYLDALVTNNVLLLIATNHDAVATPTNGWVNSNSVTYASFSINVSQLPDDPDGGYFCELQNKGDTNNCCHVFIDTLGTSVPGTYRLGIGNIQTEFGGIGSENPPINYPEDLATGVWYNVVIEFGNVNTPLALQGASLFINPSLQDYTNFLNEANGNDTAGYGYIYATDPVPASDTNILDINIAQIGFSPYPTQGNEGISNVLAGTGFADVKVTTLPVFGIQPQSGTNYSGNSLTLYAVASGVDLSYQWYSASLGALSDGPNFTGSASNTLVINSLSASDTYYCEVTDAYGNRADSSNAVEYVITTPTTPFFPANVVGVTNSAYLFTTAAFNDPAQGTGPLYYQWYFAPTNTPTTFAPLSGQTGPIISLDLADYTYQGSYYVTASNSLDGGSIAIGPTNALIELAPLNATIEQLHNLMVSIASTIASQATSTIYINTNSVAVSGYVTGFAGFGTTYSEFNIQDASGYGIEVYLYVGGNGNIYTPPVGAYITVSGPVEVYESQLEIAPASPSAIVTNPAPPITIAPVLANNIFNDLLTNGFGTNALLLGDSLLTFTNCYLYGGPNGQAFGADGTHSGVGGVFTSNSYSYLYFTIGQYGVPPSNTNAMEIYQFAENYRTTPQTPNPIGGAPIPAYCYQLTGAYGLYAGEPQLEPSRLADYVTNPPPPFTAGITQSKGVPTIGWLPQIGSTYTINSATSLLGPWTPVASGLAYYPTNGAFTDTNKALVKFYYITSP